MQNTPNFILYGQLPLSKFHVRYERVMLCEKKVVWLQTSLGTTLVVIIINMGNITIFATNKVSSTVPINFRIILSMTFVTIQTFFSKLSHAFVEE